MYLQLTSEFPSLLSKLPALGATYNVHNMDCHSAPKFSLEKPAQAPDNNVKRQTLNHGTCK